MHMNILYVQLIALSYWSTLKYNYVQPLASSVVITEGGDSSGFSGMILENHFFVLESKTCFQSTKSLDLQIMKLLINF